jgi:uracil-DNA glycosylase
MAWTERQQALLQAMGLRTWGPAASEAASERVAAPQAIAASEAALATPIAQGQRPNAPSRATVPVVAQAAVQVAGMDWTALRTAVQGCQACRLCSGRQQTVFGVGHPQAHWMLVGEAPGEQEDQQGEPFVGKAGQLLDQMLRAIGLTREAGPPGQQVFIANTLKCRPPGNRNPQPEELAACRPYLQRQIELVRPRLLLALGRFAAQSLLGSDEPIGRLRGRIHQHQGVPLVVTYHPAYLLRNPVDKAKVWEDLCFARASLGPAPA